MFAQRCTDYRPHGPHPVAPHGERTGFTCAGQPSAVELDRQLDEAFGVVTEWWVGPVGHLGVMRLPLP